MQITFRSHVCWDEEYESSIVVYHEFKMNNNTTPDMKFKMMQAKSKYS